MGFLDKFKRVEDEPDDGEDERGEIVEEEATKPTHIAAAPMCADLADRYNR